MKTDNLKISSSKEVLKPYELIDRYPLTDEVSKNILSFRKQIRNIINNDDKRLLVIIGPCSIHDVKSGYDYGQKLAKIANELKKELLIVMRVYFEKPRTIRGWKGLINDPNLDESFELEKGLDLARSLLLSLAKLGIACGTEYLDLITPQYISDLISWGAIGARTTESQTHRELASGLSTPVGFKNTTDGNIKVAIDAILSSKSHHNFLAVNKKGVVSYFRTSGNNDCHIILRGGKNTNYDAETVKKTCEALKNISLTDRLMVDFSHGNSKKQFKKQLDVAKEVGLRMSEGENSIFGVMVESNIAEGNQKINGDKSQLVYGQSITDSCIGWQDTQQLLYDLANFSAKRMNFLAKK